MHPNFREGHTLTFDVDAASGEVSRYDAVKLVGPRTVALTDTDGEGYIGVAAGDESSGIIQVSGAETRKCAIRMKGAGNVRAVAGVTDTDTLIPSGTPGELRAVDGAGGESAPEGIDGVCLAGTDADSGLALALIR